jgi:hypothetical protein
MNDQPLLQSIEPDFLPSANSRRKALERVGKFSGFALTAPIVLALMAGNASGAEMSPNVFSVLRFALLLERLEHDFYERGLRANGLIPARHRKVFETIEGHEAAHVTLLATATGRLIDADEFDFTARGRFPDAFRNYQTFLAIAQSSRIPACEPTKARPPISCLWDCCLPSL